MNIIKLEQVSSTNDYLKENYQTLNNYDICTANFQTAGRGRMNRNWESNPNTNLMLSILIKDFKKRTNYTNITLLIGTVIHKFLSDYLNNVLIKWPNDLLIEHKKIAGILAEAKSTSNNQSILIIGIGININQENFSDELKNQTTSLKLETNKTFNLDELRNKLGILLINEIDKYLMLDDSFIEYLKKYLYGKNELITYEEQGTIKKATLIDIDIEGNLLIKTPNSYQKIKTGEIKIIRKQVNEDWRLIAYENDLNDHIFSFKKFISSKDSDHAHCILCLKKITDLIIPSEETFFDGYMTINQSTLQENWVCKECFNEFKKQFNFQVKEESNLKIKKALIDDDSKEAEIIVTDGNHELLCNAYLFNNTPDFSLTAIFSTNIIKANDNSFKIIKIDDSYFGYVLQGKIIKINGNKENFNSEIIVKVFNFEIIINDDYPGDLKIGDYINFEVQKILYSDK